MNELELLRAYKKQNPWKYVLKYGDKQPEEIALTPNKPFSTGEIKVEVATAPELEVEFEAPKAVKKTKKVKATNE